MFLQHLNDRQGAAFLFLAEAVAAADGNIKYTEITKLTSFFKQLHTGMEPQECSLAEAPALFDTRKVRVSAILELLILAHTDNEYHAAERDLIGRLGDAFGISSEDLSRMTLWAARYAQLTRDARAFFDEP